VLKIDEWPIHPCIEIRRGDPTEDEQPSESSEDEDEDEDMVPVIRIKRAHLSQCPKPPPILDSWLKPNWHFVDAEPEVLSVQNLPDKKRGSISVQFTNDEERVATFAEWKTRRESWVEGERPAVAAREIFERVHALWMTVQREGNRVELVVADGILCVPNLVIKYPILFQRVTLTFNASIPEFSFTAGTERIELYKALLRLAPEIDGSMIAAMDQELDERSVAPLGCRQHFRISTQSRSGIISRRRVLRSETQPTAGTKGPESMARTHDPFASSYGRSDFNSRPHR
jgi:hypothetical protein